MRVLKSDLSIPATSFDDLLESLGGGGASESGDAVEHWFAQRGLVVGRDDGAITGFEAVDSEFDGDPEFFDDLAPFIEDGGTLHLGSDDRYLVGEVAGDAWEWTDETPTSSDGWHALGVDLQSDNYFAGRYGFEHAARHEDSDPVSWVAWLFMLENLGYHDEACEIVDEVVERAERDEHRYRYDDLRDVYSTAGRVYMYAGDHETADAFFRRALALRPADAYVWCTKACNHALCGELDEALDALERGLWIDPDYRDWAKDDPELDPLREKPAFDDLLAHGMRNHSPDRVDEIEERTERLRELMHAGSADKRREAIELALEFDDRFVFYNMLDGTRILPGGEVETGGFFADDTDETSNPYVNPYLVLLYRLPERVVPARIRGELERLQLRDIADLEDLTVLEGFPGLQYLTIPQSEERSLRELDGLAAVDGLQRLELQGLFGSALRGVGAVGSVRQLEIEPWASPLSLEGIQELDGLEAFRVVAYSGLDVEDIEPLAELDGLQTLWLSGCPSFQDLGESEGTDGPVALGELTNLRELSLCHVDWLESIQQLRPLPRLESLSLLDCPELQNLDGLSNFEHLETLDIDDAPKLRELGPLDAHPTVRKVNLTSIGNAEKKNVRTIQQSWSVVEEWLEANHNPPDADELDEDLEEWEVLERWYDANQAAGSDLVRPPASDEQIQDLEESLGVELPEDFVELLQVHDGQVENSPPLFRAHSFLSTDEILEWWQKFSDQRDGAWRMEDPDKLPDDEIRDDWWHDQWIPFAVAGGSTWLAWCVDLDPTPDGQRGQVIHVAWDTTYRGLIASSMQEWFSDLADDLEGGEFVAADPFQQYVMRFEGE